MFKYEGGAAAQTPQSAILDASAQQKLAQILASALSETQDLGDRLRVIMSAVKGRIVFSSSLGLEDQVLFHAIAVGDSPIETFSLDTGRHFAETYETLAQTERAYARKIKIYAPDAHELEELVARDGVMGFRNSVENRKACCHVRKVLPLRRALQGVSGWVTGVRRDQSSARGETPFAEYDAEFGLIKINPLADWSIEQVEAYVAENEVIINPLHAQGFPSIGCQPCTRAIAPGEPIRAGRWWWENEDQKECGLHNRPGYALRKAREKLS